MRLHEVGSMHIWLMIAGSGFLLILALLLPEQVTFLAKVAFVWALVVTLAFRSRGRMEYQSAVRLVRRGEYQQAITLITALIDTEPDVLDHRQYRAQLYLLSGDLQHAVADYEWMRGHVLGFIIGTIGLAEIEMHRGNYDQAREYALAARARDRGWMAAYDLGLIEDRKGHAELAVEHLKAALTSSIPHSRFRLLARLWLARNYHRLGCDDDAEKQIMLLRKEKKGLREWQAILEVDKGALLRELLERDVQLAQQFVESEATLEALD